MSHETNLDSLAPCHLRSGNLCVNSVIQNIPGFAYAFKLHPDGKEEFLFASNNVTETYGIDSETLQKDISKLREAFHQEDLKSFKDAMYHSAKTLTPFHCIFRYYHPKKGLIWLESNSQPLAQEDGSIIWHGITLDITKQKQAEEVLASTATRLSSLLNTIPDLVWMKDPEGIFLTCNHAFEQLFGAKSAEIIGKTDYDFWDRDLADWFRQKDKEAIAKGTVTTYENRLVYQATGKEGLLETRKAPVYSKEGNLIGVLGIAKDITEQKQAEQKIEFLANHDALTGFPNYTLAADRMKQAIRHAEQNATKIAMLFVDIDDFKAINDSLGHRTGDEIICAIGKKIKKCLRQTDTVSRQGGDEFLILLTNVRDAENVSAIADKLTATLNRSFQFNAHTLSTTVSIGITLYPNDGNTFETLLQRADIAMYKAKEAGGNAYCFFTEKMNHDVTKYLHVQNDLKQALKNNELELYYQPQINLKNRQESGVEALLRWAHPFRGMISPTDFIPIAENSGLIVPIGEWVLQEACRQGALLHASGKNYTVAVNISAVQFKRGDLEKAVKNALNASGFAPWCLELELTESILIHDTEHVFRTVQRLKNLGVKLSIDDFGTGYSSLSYLKRFAVDKLKIDRSFVKDATHKTENAAIIKAIIQMAKSLNLKTVAEGAEDEKTVALLEACGCDEVQGFYFAKPMPFPALLEYCVSLQEKVKGEICD
jgi:diguanylate cyclase (GGDEF)-like protein/PAS domain S-box-containing protein